MINAVTGSGVTELCQRDTESRLEGQGRPPRGNDISGETLQMINSTSDEEVGEQCSMQKEQCVQGPRSERACWVPYFIELGFLSCGTSPFWRGYCRMFSSIPGL